MSRRRKVLFHDGGWLALSQPEAVVEARTPGQVLPALARIEELVERTGLTAAGFIGYEAAPAFDPALRTLPPDDFPLLWFILGRRLEETEAPAAAGMEAFPDWTPSVTAAEYRAAITEIRRRIAQGDTYQVNYTYRLLAPFRGDGWELFCRMAAEQGRESGAFLDTGRYQICSASPELFFHREGERIVTRPMKGTQRRGRTAAEDSRLARRLRISAKNQAENLMIVDLLRNDLGRIAETGTVETGPLFEIERYPTLFQMTSTVTARTRKPLPEILSALFPCGSVTGAPKPSTMGIIADLESTPRRVYTGAIGLVSPGRRAVFSVAIRTILIDRERQSAEYGIGGGIVWTSRTGTEYAECRLKARIVAEERPEFSLLETLAWTPKGGYFLLDRHLQRLEKSARRFGFPVDLDRARRLLEERSRKLAERPHKVRLLLGADGSLSCRDEPLPPQSTGKRWQIALAASPIDSRNPWLLHKTTRREVYENARAGRPGFDEVILWNERGEVTEATASNIVIEKDGKLLTPPLSSGLLPGTLRGLLLDESKIKEKMITREELTKAQRIFLVNSVRGWRRAVLAAPDGAGGTRRRPRKRRPPG